MANNVRCAPLAGNSIELERCARCPSDSGPYVKGPGRVRDAAHAWGEAGAGSTPRPHISLYLDALFRVSDPTRNRGFAKRTTYDERNYCQL